MLNLNGYNGFKSQLSLVKKDKKMSNMEYLIMKKQLEN